MEWGPVPGSRGIPGAATRVQIPASVNPAPSQPPRGAPGGPGPVSLPADPRAYSGSPGLDLCHLPLLSLFLPKHWKVILSRFLTPLVPEKKKKGKSSTYLSCGRSRVSHSGRPSHATCPKPNPGSPPTPDTSAFAAVRRSKPTRPGAGRGKGVEWGGASCGEPALSDG